MSQESTTAENTPSRCWSKPVRLGLVALAVVLALGVLLIAAGGIPHKSRETSMRRPVGQTAPVPSPSKSGDDPDRPIPTTGGEGRR